MKAKLKYECLVHEGRLLPEAQLRSALHDILRDPIKGPALLFTIRKYKEEIADKMARPTYQVDPALTSLAGSLSAFERQEAELRALLQKPPRDTDPARDKADVEES